MTQTKPNNNAKDHKSTKKGGKTPGKPTRPLSAYNIFFAIERKHIIQELEENADQEYGDQAGSSVKRTKIGFANLANLVSKRWKTVNTQYKKELDDMASLEKKRYEEEMRAWRLDLATLKVQEEVEPSQTGHEVHQGQHVPRAVVPNVNEARSFFHESASYSPIIGRCLPCFEFAAATPSTFSDASGINLVTTSTPTSRHRFNASAFDRVQLPFRVEKPVSACSLSMHNGSLLNAEDAPFVRSSMSSMCSFFPPLPFAMTNNQFASNAAEQCSRHSLFSDALTTSYDDNDTMDASLHLPIEVIQRFFGIDPEENKISGREEN